MYTGIDLGQKRVHCVSLSDQLSLTSSCVLDVTQFYELNDYLTDASVVAIDAPEALSTAPHEGDETLSNKFRFARCAEVALGRERRIWVPWVTPTNAETLPGWMEVGFQVFIVAQKTGARVVEVFPYAGFKTLSPEKLPSKLTAAGLRSRAALLRSRGVEIEGLAMWSHDSLDACLAALIARDVEAGVAEPVGCGHDGSSIWLPARLE